MKKNIIVCFFVLCAVSLAAEEQYAFDHVKSISIQDGQASFLGDAFELESPPKGLVKIDLNAKGIEFLKSARSVIDMSKMGGMFILPKTIIFYDKNNEILLIGLIIYSKGSNKTFLQIRNQTKSKGGRIVVGNVDHQFQQKNAGGMEINGDYKMIVAPGS